MDYDDEIKNEIKQNFYKTIKELITIYRNLGIIHNAKELNNILFKKSKTYLGTMIESKCCPSISTINQVIKSIIYTQNNLRKLNENKNPLIDENKTITALQKSLEQMQAILSMYKKIIGL